MKRMKTSTFFLMTNAWPQPHLIMRLMMLRVCLLNSYSLRPLISLNCRFQETDAGNVFLFAARISSSYEWVANQQQGWSLSDLLVIRMTLMPLNNYLD